MKVKKKNRTKCSDSLLFDQIKQVVFKRQSEPTPSKIQGSHNNTIVILL